MKLMVESDECISTNAYKTEHLWVSNSDSAGESSDVFVNGGLGETQNIE